MQQRMMVTSAVFQAALDILMPGTVLRRVIWSETMITISGVSSCVVSLVCRHGLEVVAVKQVVFGFADWTWREFDWFRVRFGLSL